jgi:uncharacterized protein YjiS (DUF1127 family)
MTHVYNTHASKALPIWLAVVSSPLEWLERRRQRQELMGILGLPDYLIKDIGLQRHEITQEAVKPFWRR